MNVEEIREKLVGMARGRYPEEAEDIAHDILLKALRLGDIEARPFRYWHIAVKNTCATRFRDKARRANVHGLDVTGPSFEEEVLDRLAAMELLLEYQRQRGNMLARRSYRRRQRRRRETQDIRWRRASRHYWKILARPRSG